MANFKNLTLAQRFARIQKYRVTPQDFLNGKAKAGFYVRNYYPNVAMHGGKLEVVSDCGFGQQHVNVIGKPFKNNFKNFDFGNRFSYNSKGKDYWGEIKIREGSLNDLAEYGDCYHRNTEVVEFFKDINALYKTHDLAALAIVNGYDQNVDVDVEPYPENFKNKIFF